MTLRIPLFSIRKYAKHDITAYKVLHLHTNSDGTLYFSSPIQSFPYTLGHTLTSTLYRTSTRVYDGLHTFATVDGAREWAVTLRRYLSKECVIVECVIPEGSRYYSGTAADKSTGKHVIRYASDRLIVGDTCMGFTYR